jgi:hypothetical protein
VLFPHLPSLFLSIGRRADAGAASNSGPIIQFQARVADQKVTQRARATGQDWSFRIAFSPLSTVKFGPKTPKSASIRLFPKILVAEEAGLL